MGSVRITPGLEDKIRQVAARKGLSRSEVFRHALERYCDQELTPPPQSRFDDIIGVVNVPGDFSTCTRQLFGDIVEEKVRQADK